MRLTPAKVAAIRLQGRTDLIVFDDALPGFGVRVLAGGKRTWVLQYRVPREARERANHKLPKSRREVIGNVALMSLEDAREEARARLRLVARGLDPETERARAAELQAVEAARALPFGELARQYLDRKVRPQRRPRYVAEVERYLTRTLENWAALPLDALDRRIVAKRLAEIATEHGPVASIRARAAVSAMFKWAIGEGYADTNPVVGTNKATKEDPRERVLKDYELAAVWKACRDDDYGRIVRLLILTGQRRDEVGSIERVELDIDKALWSLPGSRTKNGLPHDVPLAAPALAIVGALLERERRGPLFGTAERAFSGWSKAKAGLDRRIAESGAEVDPWRLHDIRRTVVTGMGEIGIPPHIVEAVVNHVSGVKAGVAGTYNRAVYAAEKRQALERWGAHVEAIVRGTPGKVVPLFQAAG